MSVYVIVDDSDDSIEYSPVATNANGQISTSPQAEVDGWFVAGTGDPSEFLKTTSGSGLASSTMSYTFNGSSISVFGTTPGLSVGTVNYTNTTVSFDIDGNPFSTVITTQVPANTRRHVPFFVSPALSPSSHTLEIKVLTSASARNESDFLVDYLIYNAPVNSTISTSADGQLTSWIFVDDRSPYLNYSEGGWSNDVLNFPGQADFNLTDASFNSSVTGPTGPSSTVSLNFTGTSSIRAYGMIIDPATVLGTFSFDGQPSSPLSLPPTTASYPIYNWELLDVSNLASEDSHTLEIKADAANSFYLDYILLDSGSAFITVPSSPSSSTSAVSQPTSTGGGGGRATSSKHTDMGAIVGGVVGGILALCAVGIAVFVWLRRRRGVLSTDGIGMYAVTEYGYRSTIETSERGLPAGVYQGQTVNSPYTTTPSPFVQTSRTNSLYPNSHSRKSGSHTRTGVVSSASRYAPNTSTNTNTSDSDTSTSRRVAGESSMDSPGGAFMVESDSGLRGIVGLPPQYTAE